MPIGNKKPRDFLRFGFRLPIWLYRMQLGWVLGERFLLLTRTGRKSGRMYQTIIEVVRHDKETGTYPCPLLPWSQMNNNESHCL